MLLKTAIVVFQLVTATTDLTPEQEKQRIFLIKKMDSYKDKTKRILLRNELNENPINEMTLKNYVDNPLTDAINQHKSNFPSYNIADPKYELIDKFIETYFNSAMILSKLQGLGNRNPTKPIHYSVAIHAAYYPYILDKLIKHGALPLDKDRKRISFDMLYAYITDAISEIKPATSGERDELLNNTTAAFTAITDIIQKSWNDDFLNPKTITEECFNEINNTALRIVYNVQDALTGILDKLYGENKIEYETYFKILNFYEMVVTVSFIAKDFARGLTKLSPSDASNPLAEYEFWIDNCFLCISSFINNAVCFILGQEKIDAFVTSMESAYQDAIAEDEEIKRTSKDIIPSDTKNSLFGMITLNQPLNMGNHLLNLVIDRTRIKKSEPKNPFGKTGKTKKTDKIKDTPQVKDDKIFVWIMLGLIIGIIVLITIYISYFIFQKCYA